jgi:hypothetical protein
VRDACLLRALHQLDDAGMRDIARCLEHDLHGVVARVRGAEQVVEIAVGGEQLASDGRGVRDRSRRRALRIEDRWSLGRLTARRS